MFDALESKWTARRLANCNNIWDLRKLAKRRVPRGPFDYLDGGAEDEITYARNVSAFNRYNLLPRALVDITEIDLSTTVQGQPVDLPFIFSPVGMPRLFHHVGERATSVAAARAGTIFSLSTVSSVSIEEVASVCDGPKWFQIYVFRDRDIVKEMIERARASGYQALCLTVDVPVAGNRERDVRNGFTVPPKLRISTFIEAALHLEWCFRYLTNPPFTLANVADRAGSNDLGKLTQYINRQFDHAVTWDDAAWMLELWGGPFLIKGIVRKDDAQRAVDIGASGIIVSNHGGRQLEHSPAAIEALPAIVDAVGDQAEVILDGGIRRGTDIAKALALGARACMGGRAIHYGLGAGGEAGVDRAVEILRSELYRNFQLLGCRSIAELDHTYIEERRD